MLLDMWNSQFPRKPEGSGETSKFLLSQFVKGWKESSFYKTDFKYVVPVIQAFRFEQYVFQRLIISQQKTTFKYSFSAELIKSKFNMKRHQL